MDDAGETRRSTASLLPPEVLPGVRVCANEDEVARAAARLFVDWAWQFIAREGSFCVALSGGNTPRRFYKLLGSREFRTQIDWGKVHLFWGDERAVSPEDPESNYGLARRELLVHIPIPPANVHRMEAERSDLGRAAHDYEEVLRHFLPLNAEGFPRFHVIFLGLGADGHTASLFPGARPRATLRWVSTPVNPRRGARRMSLTLPVLNAGYRVLFLVTGENKAQALHDVLFGTHEPPLPARLVTAPEGVREFLVDRAAASRLGVRSAARTKDKSGRAR